MKNLKLARATTTLVAGLLSVALSSANAADEALLDVLLGNGVINQEQYDGLIEKATLVVEDIISAPLAEGTVTEEYIDIAVADAVALKLDEELSAETSGGQSNNEFYGRANISLNKINQESVFPVVNEYQLNSNASRIGFRGSYPVSDSIEAIYQIEFESHFDDGSSSSSKGNDTLEARNSYGGFRGNFGRIIAGRHDTPLKLLSREVDRFNDQVLGDIRSFVEGEDRLSNLVMYTTPSWNGFSATTALLPAEDSTGITQDDGLTDGSSSSIDFRNDFMRASVAYNEDVNKQDITRLMTNFYIGKTELGFLWQDADRTDVAADQQSWLISAEHRINDQWRVKGQYGKTEHSVLSNEDEQFALGADYILKNGAFIFANYIQDDRDNELTSYSDTSVALGFQINF